MEIESFETLKPSGQQHNNPTNQISPKKNLKKLTKLLKNGARATQNRHNIYKNGARIEENELNHSKWLPNFCPDPFGPSIA